MNTQLHSSLTSLDPEAAAMLGRVFEDIWATLEQSGSPLALGPRVEQTREALALRIIDVAQRGERDPNRLRDDALAYLGASLAGA